MEPIPEDLVVLLDSTGRPCGSADRRSVHGVQTPLHLAFSCYLVNRDNQVLLTRRALAKRTWPGVWTNSCCGHPRPGEPMTAAIERRVTQELAVRATRIGVVLPDFRYQAVDASGIRENEVCPVYVATFEGDVDPDPDEVMEHRWVDVAVLADVATRAPWLLSPWSVAQIGQMDLGRISSLLGPPVGDVAAVR